MKRALLIFLAIAPLVAAQEIKFPPGLDKLADKADETVDVTLDSSLLQLASRFLSDKDKDEAKVKKLVAGLQGVYVKSFEFDEKGAYNEADVEFVRNQLHTPGWSRIVGVRSHRNGENCEVYIKHDGEKIGGLVVIVAEPKELTFVNIVGTLRPEDLRDLGGNFGIPRLDVNIGRDKTGSKEN
ncbi:MAG TPA: DUF4252 domain-containing protein [Bryobacteraceae bacterium]|nr:DUF4252 domain-containing protein [Bryobacteraceae bacterium]